MGQLGRRVWPSSDSIRHGPELALNLFIPSLLQKEVEKKKKEEQQQQRRQRQQQQQNQHEEEEGEEEEQQQQQQRRRNQREEEQQEQNLRQHEEDLLQQQQSNNNKQQQQNTVLTEKSTYKSLFWHQIEILMAMQHPIIRRLLAHIPGKDTRRQPWQLDQQSFFFNPHIEEWTS